MTETPQNHKEIKFDQINDEKGKYNEEKEQKLVVKVEHQIKGKKQNN